MERNPGQVYKGDMNTTENQLHNKCYFLIDGRLHGAHEGQAGVGLEGGSGYCITMLHHNMEPGCRREASPDMSRITGHAIVLRRFLVGCRTSDIDFWPPRRIRDTSTCVSSAPMKGTPRAFSGWRRCRYAIRQPRRGKRPRPRHRQIPGSLRKIFILVLPRPGACHGVRPACPASVCCVHGPRLR